MQSPIIIVHGKNDHNIPFGHSDDLFNARIQKSQLGESETSSSKSYTVPNKMEVHSTNIERLGTVKVAEDVTVATDELPRRTVLLITEYGGHNRVNGYEGVMEVIRREIGTELH